MGKIDEHIEARIKSAASIIDAVTDGLGIQLTKSGENYLGLCPFHDDRHLGSFVVSECRNIATCFACGRTWSPIDIIMEGLNLSYPDTLRWFAAKYNIFIDNDPVPSVKPSSPRILAPELPIITWPIDICQPYMKHESDNKLLNYLLSLPMTEEDKKRLTNMINGYMVGTSMNGRTKGWTIWWQIDENLKVRTGKLMAYKEDGHRDKENNYSFDFTHSLLEKSGAWSKSTNRYEGCLFGLHLVDLFKEAEICIVESEKSALICSAFTNPNKRLWLATAGKSNLTYKKLLPLIERKRYIVLYPDHDGYKEWSEMAKRIPYNRITVSNKVNELWKPSDGEKADIADIMLRELRGIEESETEKACRRLGITDNKELENFITTLGLKVID